MGPVIRLTLNELFRRRVTQFTLLTALVFLGVFWYLLDQIPAQSLVQNPLGNVAASTMGLILGLFFCYFIVAFFAVLTTTGSISGDIESGLLLVLVARPIGRIHVVLGKWIGIAVVQTSMVVLVVGGVSIIMNHTHPGLLPLGIRTVGLLLLFGLEAWVLSALTLLCSVGLSAMASGVIMTMSFLLAFVLGVFGQLSSTFYNANLISNLVLPTDGLYRRAIYSALGQNFNLFGHYLGPFGVRQVPSNLFIAYAGAYVLAALALASYWFGHRDL